MVNWDPSAQTALSDEEVVFKESHGKLYYLRYRVEGTDRTIIVATQQSAANIALKTSFRIVSFFIVREPLFQRIP